MRRARRADRLVNAETSSRVSDITAAARANFKDCELVQGPDLAGPYCYRNCGVFNEMATGLFTYQRQGKQVVVPAPKIPGYEIQVVFLEARSGESTFVILKRKLP